MFVPDVLEKVRVPFSGRTTRRLAAVMTMTGWCAQAQPLAVYDFSAGTVGAAADVIADAQGDATYAGQASATSAQGVVPYYTNNAPNRIATDYTCRAFYHAPKALAFEYGKDPGGSSTPPGGQVNFPDLAARLIGRAQAYTIEYFVRLDESFDYGVNGYKYKSKTSMFVGGDDYGYKVVTPSDSDAAQVTKLAIQIEDGNTRPSAARNDWFNNGRWHHLACVYKPGEGGATRGTLTFFVDYVSVGTFDFDNKTPNNTPVFRLGTGRDGKRDTEPFHGWVTCLRVTERALGWEEMMVIVPDVSQMETAGFWDFKERRSGFTMRLIRFSSGGKVRSRGTARMRKEMFLFSARIGRAIIFTVTVRWTRSFLTSRCPCALRLERAPTAAENLKSISWAVRSPRWTRIRSKCFSGAKGRGITARRLVGVRCRRME